MKWYYKRKWLTLVALTIGTTFQLATCRSELALLSLRTAFSTVTLPINAAIQQFLLSFG